VPRRRRCQAVPLRAPFWAKTALQEQFSGTGARRALCTPAHRSNRGAQTGANARKRTQARANARRRARGARKRASARAGRRQSRWTGARADRGTGAPPPAPAEPPSTARVCGHLPHSQCLSVKATVGLNRRRLCPFGREPRQCLATRGGVWCAHRLQIPLKGCERPGLYAAPQQCIRAARGDHDDLALAYSRSRSALDAPSFSRTSPAWSNAGSMV